MISSAEELQGEEVVLARMSNGQTIEEDDADDTSRCIEERVPDELMDENVAD